MKRVLIIANNCFSNTNSNGRTLGNLFYLYKKDKISQFYISGEPDYTFCQNYYNVSDIDAINSIFPFKRKKNVEKNSKSPQKRTVKNMILRNIVWNLGFWKNKNYNNWLNKINPEIVVLQVGDCAFMIKIALSIAKKFNSKLIVYNSEGYYFKDFNYFRDGQNRLYKIFIENYKRNFRKLINKAYCSIYLCDMLKDDYDKIFHKRSIVVYNSSSIKSLPFVFDNYPIITYIGNLELGRDESLCELSDVFSSFNKTIKINVYGNASNVTLDLFKKHKGINYCGFICYDKVKDVILNSHVLLHVESFNEFYIKDTKYGFSGKLADILCSGRICLVYAPNNIACVDYLKRNNVGMIATNINELNEIAFSVLQKNNIVELIDAQNKLALQNHNLIKSSKIIVDLLNE